MRLFVDLFCGCGGMSEGLRQAGMKPICGVDIDNASLKTYAANFKSAVALNAHVGAAGTLDKLRRIRGTKTLHAVVGGPPCQPYSSLNVYKESSDTRRDLPMAFVHTAVSLEPKYIVMEEVVNFVKGGHRQRVLNALARAGYGHVSEHVVNAVDCGAATLRRRYILIATRNHVDMPRNWPPRPMLQRTCVAKAWRSNRPKGRPADALPHPYPIPPSIQRKITEKMKNPSKSKHFVFSYSLMQLDKPSLTLTTNCAHPGSGRFTVQTQHGEFKRLTVHQAKVIQGFPAQFYFMAPEGALTDIGQAYKQIGNSVSPPMAKAIGLAIK